MKWTHEVVILEVSLQFNFRVGVNSLPIHLVGHPLASIVAIVRPSIGTLAMPVTVLKLPFVDIPVRKHVQTYIQ
jgi:hypothetical protein